MKNHEKPDQAKPIQFKPNQTIFSINANINPKQPKANHLIQKVGLTLQCLFSFLILLEQIFCPVAPRPISPRPFKTKQ